MLSTIGRNCLLNDPGSRYERKSVKELVQFFNEKDNSDKGKCAILSVCKKEKLRGSLNCTEIKREEPLGVHHEGIREKMAQSGDKHVKSKQTYIDRKVKDNKRTTCSENVDKIRKQKTAVIYDETIAALRSSKLSMLYEKRLDEMLIFNELKITNVQQVKLSRKKKIQVSNRKIMRYNTCSMLQADRVTDGICTGKEKKAIQRHLDRLKNDCIEYEKLDKFEKWQLAVYCMAKLRKMAINENVFLKSFNFILRLFKLYDVAQPKLDGVNPVIFNLINHLKIHGQKEVGIFRLSGRLQNVQVVINKIKEQQKINPSTYAARDIVSLLKIYIRNDLDGVCTKDITKVLLSIFHRNGQVINSSLKYLPFIFYGDRRKLLVSIFELFDEISDCEFHNKMNRQKLIHCTAPTFFSTVEVLNLSIVSTQIKIVETLGRLDFKYVPKDLYKKAMRYG
ncbi:hypothetical protein VCUG_02466 [Vavraia culicis subsp. floridensis]|uniref:Rho-GAP domain-containing protein n=1 Tax=Vavraia culicis (isolate floridensis) TaxID=948595 RepID=L2GRX0_VAVCU|nr:uncharacterized protein VCUG_02466 [Vavraia culicis subsp. floridensis]ELA46048.1 hypothetical protein VCUG_02466 [Vavraia culicis subsp. floridensis]